jgi:hypothetical protein
VRRRRERETYQNSSKLTEPERFVSNILVECEYGHDFAEARKLYRIIMRTV